MLDLMRAHPNRGIPVGGETGVEDVVIVALLAHMVPAVHLDHQPSFDEKVDARAQQPSLGDDVEP
nr:hypothetical protein [Leucobacter chromiireducens]